jgi:tRNA nucleotidyltransferase (CCA-adding enzyme)
MNAIALSLNRASRGLLIDPTNGAADIERREIRACSNYALYDDPIRLFRLLRFKARMALKSKSAPPRSSATALEADMAKHVPPRALYRELRQIALEAAPDDLLRLFEEEGLLGCFSPALAGAKVNHAGFQKLAKRPRHDPLRR